MSALRGQPLHERTTCCHALFDCRGRGHGRLQSLELAQQRQQSRKRTGAGNSCPLRVRSRRRRNLANQLRNFATGRSTSASVTAILLSTPLSLLAHGVTTALSQTARVCGRGHRFGRVKWLLRLYIMVARACHGHEHLTSA